MTVADEVAALRSSAGLSRPTHIAMVHVGGPDAQSLLQDASTQSPYAREGRVRHTLFLREDGSVFADALVVKVEERFFVLAEGPDEAALVAWLDRAKGEKDVTIDGMSDAWAILGIDGPYAWEVVGGLLGPAVYGMPYLTLLRRDDVVCMRAGKTGEYGYLLLVPRSNMTEVEARLVEIGAPLDLVRVGLEALDTCALESWHFSMRMLRTPLTPIELQLQWRVNYAREFIGAVALRALRAEGAKVRLTCFIADRAVAPGDRVRLAGLEIGEVLIACASPTLDRTMGAALLERRFAHPHLTLSTRDASLRTCTGSLVMNKSLSIQPHKHSYATRLENA
jgi:aminomethyltransferase